MNSPYPPARSNVIEHRGIFAIAQPSGGAIQRLATATVVPLPPSASPPLEIAAPQPPPPADQDEGVFSALERIPDLLRPAPPAATGETPRPPMPIGTASPE